MSGPTAVETGAGVRDELVDVCVKLAREGMSDVAIGVRLGLDRSTVAKKRVKGGVRRPRNVVTSEQRAQIDDLADDGVSVNEIARTVCVSWPTVAKQRPDAVWTTQQAAEWGAWHRKPNRGRADGAKSMLSGIARR